MTGREATSGAPPRRRGRSRRGSRRVHLSLWLLLTLVVGVVAFAAGLLGAPVDLAQPPALRPALIVDRQGSLFGEITTPEEREDVSGDLMPKVLRQAVVAAEDKRFYSHGGIDPSAIVRAAVADVTGKGSEGGSTITQQYVKKVFVGSQHSLLRKVREAALAIRLEQRLSKDEILTRYLNIIPFGQGTYGVQAASKFYFGIPVSQLNLAQASMLAGVIPAPSLYNPVTSMRLARQRQTYVLGQMVDDHVITRAQATAAYRVPPKIVAASTAVVPTSAPQFFQLVKKQIVARYAKDNTLYEGALSVRTTLDLSWQQAISDALTNVLPSAGDPEAAVIAIDYTDGDVLGLVDKVDAAHAQYDPATLAVRSSGSTIKPFTLAAALNAGMTLNTFRQAPVRKTYTTAECGTPPYTITNDEGGGGGYTLRSALADSVNTVYGPLAIELGTTKVAALAKAAGLGDSHGNLGTTCAMGLGVEITPLSEAVGYATLADGGVRHDPRFVLDVKGGVDAAGEGGTTIYTAPDTAGTRVLSQQTADDVVKAMGDVVRYGTGTAARPGHGLDVFGKTGTTDNFENAWFSGCITAYHVCLTTWMGYDTPRPLQDVEGVRDVYGGTLPAKIFAATVQNVRAKLG